LLNILVTYKINKNSYMRPNSCVRTCDSKIFKSVKVYYEVRIIVCVCVFSKSTMSLTDNHKHVTSTTE